MGCTSLATGARNGFQHLQLDVKVECYLFYIEDRGRGGLVGLSLGGQRCIGGEETRASPSNRPTANQGGIETYGNKSSNVL
jgi:hypothetical protein